MKAQSQYLYAEYRYEAVLAGIPVIMLGAFGIASLGSISIVPMMVAASILTGLLLLDALFLNPPEDTSR